MFKETVDFKIGILGCGTMGRQIALLFAKHGFSVKVWDVVDRSSLEKVFEKCRPEIKEKIQITTDLSQMNDCDFIEECVIEDDKIKKDLYSKLSSFISDKTIVATNTSSLSIKELSESIKYPENFIGVHFFNPVDKVDLVEAIFLSSTLSLNKDVVINLLKSIQRKPVFVSDTAGFIVNRLLIPMINEAAKLLEQNAASAEEIDEAMHLGARHRIGPLTLGDFIGLDVCLAIMKNLNLRLKNDKFNISPLLEKKVSEGNLGRKTGKGFYEY